MLCPLQLGLRPRPPRDTFPPVPQGSYNRPLGTSGTHADTLFLDCTLRGLQLESSDACSGCLARLLLLLRPQASRPHGCLEEPPPAAGEGLGVLWKVDLRVEDVNLFTRSASAGEPRGGRDGPAGWGRA